MDKAEQVGKERRFSDRACSLRRCPLRTTGTPYAKEAWNSLAYRYHGAAAVTPAAPDRQRRVVRFESIRSAAAQSRPPSG